MKLRTTLASLTALAALSLAPTALAAQQMMMPEPISADAPTAKRARAVAELVLAGDQQKLEAYLKEHAAPSLTGSASFSSDVAAVIAAAKTGARTIVRLDGLGQAGVGVALGQAEGAEPERAVVVGLEPDAPHRVTRLLMVRISMGGN